jgi:hypothetical protein
MRGGANGDRRQSADCIDGGTALGVVKVSDNNNKEL